MPNLTQQAGGQPQKQPKYVPIFIDRSFTGMFTQRSPLHDPSSVVESKYYGGRPDALWAGRNVELTNRLTLMRRPGLSSFSTATYPTPPDESVSFQLSDGTVRVIIDTESTGNLVLTSVLAESGGIAVYTGTITGGASNAYAGLTFQISGFLTLPNNGTFVCTASTITTLTLDNGNAVTETDPATANSAGAVYWDQQTGGLKTLLFAKNPGAGQTHFIGVAGILYAGDGVDIWKWTPLNTNTPPGSSVSVWNWGIAAPLAQPIVSFSASGAGDPTWQANTFYTTMGLTVDTYGQIWQLIGVNALPPANPTAIYGTAGSGTPPWNQAMDGTTLETSGTPITWTNYGQIQAWAAGTAYGDAGEGAPLAPAFCYDPGTGGIFGNFHNSGQIGYSGAIKPNFNLSPTASFTDGPPANSNQPGCKWFLIGTVTTLQPWLPGHVYNVWVGGGSASLLPARGADVVVEPFTIPPTAATPIYLQTPTAGTSGTAYTPFPNPALAVVPITVGYQQPDNQLLWQCLATVAEASWISGASYIPWTVAGSTFSVVYEQGNMHVATGTSPLVAGTPTPKWGTKYGDTAIDGNIIWICVGPPTPWVAGSSTTGIWYLPLDGFQPPQPSQQYGGSTINSSNGLVESAVVSGLSGTVAPTWSAEYGYTGEQTPLGLTSVGVAGTVVTYHGSITGGGSNALAGATFLISGFTKAGNNGFINVVSSTAGTLVAVLNATGPQVAEIATAYAQGGLIWYAESVVSTLSVTWVNGLSIAYSYKARATDDFYSPLPLGGGNSPPQYLPLPVGAPAALGAPTGSATNAVSTASPAYNVVGANAGAIITISGMGSPDPQVDTIIVWVSEDELDGFGQMYEATEFPAPKPTLLADGAYQANPWTFQYYLPFVATAVYPGLNTLIPAPINDANDPPDSTFLPMVFNFQRIWGADGEFVPFSGGPDTLVGNPNECFLPSSALPFLAPVIRVVRTPQGLVTFLTNSVEVIGGGPATPSFYSVTWCPGVGLLSYNALDILAGEMYFFSPDLKFRIMTPALNMSEAGFPLGDQFANMPTSGVSDTTWYPANVYVASHQNGLDSAIFVADGATGWYRLNPHQAGAGITSNTDAVWSPFAVIQGAAGPAGCKMVKSVEASPGTKTLLVGGTGNGQTISKRVLGIYTDNSNQYDAWFTMGSIVLASPGQLCLLKFAEFDFSGVSYQPTISFLLNEISGTFTAFTLAPQFDPPSFYGTTIAPTSYSPNRYYFDGTGSLARCRHMQLKVDFGTTSNPDEMNNATIFGRLMVDA